MTIPSHPQIQDMNIGEGGGGGGDKSRTVEFVPDSPHPKVQCTRCKIIPIDTMEAEQIWDALLSDMEHWVIDMPDQKLSNYGAKAWIHVNRVMTARAITGDLGQIGNIAGYCMGTAKKFVSEIENLRSWR